MSAAAAVGGRGTGAEPWRHTPPLGLFGRIVAWLFVIVPPGLFTVFHVGSLINVSTLDHMALDEARFLGRWHLSALRGDPGFHVPRELQFRNAVPAGDGAFTGMLDADGLRMNYLIRGRAFFGHALYARPAGVGLGDPPWDVTPPGAVRGAIDFFSGRVELFDNLVLLRGDYRASYRRF